MKRIEEIKARLEAATKGPWTRFSQDNGYNCVVAPYPDGGCFNIYNADVAANNLESDETKRGHNTYNNAKFIANAPTDIQYLLFLVEAAEEMRQALEFYAEAVENMKVSVFDHLGKDKGCMARDALEKWKKAMENA